MRKGGRCFILPLFSTYILHIARSVFRISYQAYYLQDQQDNLFVPDRPFLLLRQPDLLLEVSHGAQPFPRLPPLPIAFASLQHPFLVRPTDQLAPSLFAVLVQERVPGISEWKEPAQNTFPIAANPLPAMLSDLSHEAIF